MTKVCLKRPQLDSEIFHVVVGLHAELGVAMGSENTYQFETTCEA